MTLADPGPATDEWTEGPTVPTEGGGSRSGRWWDDVTANLRRAGPWLGAVLVPWLWFVVRDWHPRLEYVALGLPVLGGAALLVLAHFTLARRSARLFVAAASTAVFLAVAILSPMRPVDRGSPVNPARMVTVNLGGLWFSDNDLGYLHQWMAPNVVVGSELAQSHDEVMRDRFPHAVSDIIPLTRTQANRDGLGPQTDDYRAFGFPSIGVYSDYPISRLADPIADMIDGGLPGIRARLSLPDGDVVLYALHIPRPGSGGVYEVPIATQSAMVDEIVAAIEAETLPVIVIGDLNVVDRSESYRDFRAHLHDAMREEQWADVTRQKDFWFMLLLARIDHLFVSDELCVENALTDDLAYTNHRAVRADVGFCEGA